MPSTRAPKIENRTSRLKLARRRKPYFVTIAPTISLGYRRNAGAGTWSVRASDGHGGNWLKSFAIADDQEDANGRSVMSFWQAQDRARALARAGEGNNTERPATVGEAIDNYAADLLARGARPANSTQLAFNVPSTLLAKPVATLTARELRTWRNGLVKRGLKPSSADRVSRVLKAALNLAAADDARITNAKEWRDGLKPLPDADVARNVILADQVVAAVVRAAYTNDPDIAFGLMIETLAETGAREVQVLRLIVADLVDASNSPRLMMPSSRKGRSRHITRTPVAISMRLARKFRQAARGRSAEAPLLDPVKHISARFRAATKSLDLDPRATPYALRHSSIVRMLLASVPTRVVAAHHNTSVKMIERHYSAFILDVSDTLTRGTLLDLDQPPSGVVVPLRGA